MARKPVPKNTKSIKENIEEIQLDLGLYPPLPGVAPAFMEALEGKEPEKAYADLLESICGATDDSQPVEQYDGTLGVTAAFVSARQSCVAQVQWNNDLATRYSSPGNVNGVRWGTGTMIANDLFLTAGHLFDQTGGGWTRPRDNMTGTTISPAEIATNMHLNFNFQVDPSGTLRPEVSFPIIALLEFRLGGLDYAICRIGGNPGATFGVNAVSTTDATAGAMLCIIGHPAGVPKRIEAGPALAPSGDAIRYDSIDTLGGNSGSGVLRSTDGLLVGVHTNGGCTTTGGFNFGTRITSIRAQSPILQGLPGTATTVITDTSLRDDFSVTTIRNDRTAVFADTSPSADLLTTTIVSDRLPTSIIRDVGTSLVRDQLGTTKAIDDVKIGALDKQFSDRKLPGSDVVLPDDRFTDPFGGTLGGARPFVFATPHHATRIVNETPMIDAQAQFDAALMQLEQSIQDVSIHLEALQRQYQQAVEEYQQFNGGV